MKNHNIPRLLLTPIALGLMVAVVLALSLSVSLTPAGAASNSAASLCGEGSPPDYGFTYDLQQPHWTVGWENYASEQTVNRVDTVLDQLNADSIAQTMILILPQDQVGIPVNCAVHFLRYMKLGLPTGARKDNGFVFLIIAQPNSIAVHYGVGLGLPALTAPNLTDLNRLGEDTYQSTHSMDQALLALVQGFDTYVRTEYSPLTTPTPVDSSQTTSGALSVMTACVQPCLIILLILFLLWLASKGIVFFPFDSGSAGMGFPGGGGGWGGGGGGGGFSRGGSGSGRSGRGN